MKKIIITLAHLLIITSLFAQAPDKISYQAVARDLSGNPMISTSLTVVYEIRQGSASGAVVYSETQNPTTNQFGLFTTEIGNGTPTSGTFAGIAWGTAAFYLQVTVNGDVMPATQLLSVPYALFSKTSGNGPPGLPGNNSLANATPEAPGANCANGGTMIDVGVDDNPADGTLQAIEIDFTYYVCNGDSGAIGTKGPIGLTGLTGATGIAGPAGPTGTTGPQGIIGLTGAVGATGAQGPIGLTGATGVAGATGAVGPSGPDNQDLTLTGNSLGLTNDLTPVNLTPYLDNTDAQTLTYNSGTQNLAISNGNAVTLDVNDADSDSTNERNTSFVINGVNLDLTDAGGTLSVPLSGLSPAALWTQGTAGALFPTTITNKVGIGINTPVYPLDVFSPTADAVINIESNNSPQNTMAGLRFAMGNQSITGTQYYMYAEKINNIVNGTPSDFIMRKDFSTVGGYLKFFRFDNNSSDIIINDSKTTTVGFGNFIVKNGNVGIGTTSPTQKLQIENGRLRVSNAGINMDLYQIGTASRLEADNSFEIVANGSGSAGFIIDDADAFFDVVTTVRSNTTSSFPRLQLLNTNVTGDASMRFSAGGTTIYTIGSDPNDNMFKISNGSALGINDRFSIDNTGNVGIGTTSPAEKLDVAGNVIAADYLYTTPKTRYLTLGESDFGLARSAAGDIERSFGAGGVGIVNSGAPNALVAPIHLPQGAVVTSVIIYYVDNSTSNMTLYFQRRTLAGSLSNISFFTTAANSAAVLNTSLTGTTIDNINNSYNMRIYSTAWTTGASKTMEIKTVKIIYTITTTD